MHIILPFKTFIRWSSARVANLFLFFLQILNKFSCITLGGLVAAHLVFGHSEGHDSDVHKVRLNFFQ